MARTKKDRPGESGPVPHQGTTPHTQEDTMTGTPTITIPGRRLYDMVASVLPFASTVAELMDLDMPDTPTICVEADGASLCVVARDVYGMAVAQHRLDAPVGYLQATMTATEGRALAAALAEAGVEDVTITREGREVVARTETQVLGRYQAGGYYVDWRAAVHGVLSQRRVDTGYTVLDPSVVARLQPAVEASGGAPMEVLCVTPYRQLVRVGDVLAVLRAPRVDPEWGGRRVLDLAADLARVEALPAPADPGDELVAARRRIRDLENMVADLEEQIGRMVEDGYVDPDALREQGQDELLDAVGAVFARAYGSE